MPETYPKNISYQDQHVHFLTPGDKPGVLSIDEVLEFNKRITPAEILEAGIAESEDLKQEVQALEGDQAFRTQLLESLIKQSGLAEGIDLDARSPETRDIILTYLSSEQCAKLRNILRLHHEELVWLDRENRGGYIAGKIFEDLASLALIRYGTRLWRNAQVDLPEEYFQRRLITSPANTALFFESASEASMGDLSEDDIGIPLGLWGLRHKSFEKKGLGVPDGLILDRFSDGNIGIFGVVQYQATPVLSKDYQMDFLSNVINVVSSRSGKSKVKVVKKAPNLFRNIIVALSSDSSLKVDTIEEKTTVQSMCQVVYLPISGMDLYHMTTNIIHKAMADSS